MNFTYDQPSEQLIFTTRRDTQKAANLELNPRVAILLHDFPHLRATAGGEGYGRSCSITLYGEARVLPDGPVAELLRARHLTRNPDQVQFIRGPGIAVVSINIEKARVCDNAGSVTSWSVSDGWGK